MNYGRIQVAKMVLPEPLVQNNSNTYVIWDVNCTPHRFVDGMSDYLYEWTRKPESAWCFSHRAAAINRAAHVAHCGHNVKIITRAEALELVKQHAPQNTVA